MMGSDDIKRAIKEGLVMLTCYALYIILFVMLAIKLWVKIK